VNNFIIISSAIAESIDNNKESSASAANNLAASQDLEQVGGWKGKRNCVFDHYNQLE